LEGVVVDEALSYYFELLSDVVRRMGERGGKTFAAGVKPALQQLAIGGFDEEKLGFTSFAGFLRAAEAAGVVDLMVDRPGLLRVALPSNKSAPELTEAVETDPPTLREDLWRAFVDWTPGCIRFFDTEGKAAHVLAKHPVPAESAEDAALRAAVESQPSRFPEIEPISLETTLAWMKEYAEQLDEPNRSLIAAALTSERPAREFSLLVRRSANLSRSWHRFRLARVRATVQSWLTERGLEIEIDAPARVVDEHQADRVRPARPSARPDRATRRNLHENDVRHRVVRAVERMPLRDLLELPIPFEYFLD